MTNGQNKPRLWLRILCVCGAAVVGITALAAGGWWWLYSSGRHSLLGGDAPSVDIPSSLVDDGTEDGTRVVYQGQAYRLNPNLVSILCIGVDKGSIQENAGYGENGQADSLFLVALDTETGALTILPLSREILAKVDVYSADGSYIGVQNTQLCLAYSYGKTGEESCQNVLRSVSRLLYGMDIQAYLAIDMKGLEALTDKLGGIQLTALETLYANADDPSTLIVRQGQSITLRGTLTNDYIRSRGDDVEANVRRMQRQKQFLNALMQKAGNRLKSNISLLPSYYNTVKPYMVSNLTLSQITYLASSALATGIPSPQYESIEGSSRLQGEHVAFIPEEASLYEATLKLFYLPEDS